jgi:serine/threonine protein kinase
MSEKAPCPNCGELLTPGSFCPKDGAKVPAIMDFTPGARIGKYIVEEKIGEGGMGEVWSGKNPEINKRVAIKILNPQLLANAQAIARFKREALAVNEIRHKNLVDIFDIGEMADGRPYFVMEHLIGEPLDEYMKRKGPLSFSEILAFLQPICKALAATHQRNIIHRDLKPENIFLVKEDDEPQPIIKILDFGIAKLSTPEESQNNVTRTGSVIGTPAYMSPEQCEGSKAVDHRSDIYSLGVILFEMITGRTPFQEPGEGTGMVLAKHITMPIPSASRTVMGRKLSKEVDLFLQKALAKNPNDRTQNANDFYRELTEAINGAKEETHEQVKGAKPIYEKNPVLPPPPNHTPIPIQVALPPIALPQEESPSRTGDYYTGDNEDSALKPKRNNKVLVAGAALSLVIGIGLTAFFMMPPVEKPVATLTPAQIPAQTILPTPTTPATLVNDSNPAPNTAVVTPPALPEKVLLIVTTDGLSSTKVFLDGQELGSVPINQPIAYQDKDIVLRLVADGYEPKEISIHPTKDVVQFLGKKDLTKIVTKNPFVKKSNHNKAKTCFTPEGLAYKCK